MIDERCKRYEPFFGKWKLDRELGKGMSGQVYQIYWDDELGKRTTSALKYIHIPSDEALAIQKEIQPNMRAVYNYFFKQVEKIREEILILQKCKGHSNIVSYEDHMIVESAGGIGWDILIRMELLYPLNACFGKNDANQYDVVKMWLDITSALIYCEDQNIIHRDIKPANILISQNGSYKLSDFGTARKNMEGAMASTRVGTQKYMAPEVERDLKYDKRADYYSLGSVVYFFLNKRRMPFYPPYPDSVNLEAICMAEKKKLVGEKIPKIPWVSNEVNHILLKCLEYKPENRYNSARELYDELYKLLKEQGDDLKKRYLNIERPLVPEKTTVVPEEKKYTGKKKKIIPNVILVVLAGIFLLGGIGGIVYEISTKYNSKNDEKGAEGNYIAGIEQDGDYTTETKITISAIGAGMDIEDPIKGDIRYQPLNWSILEARDWDGAPYSVTFRVEKSGNYTLTVNYNQQQFDGQRWVDTGKTDTKTVEFHIT